MTDGIRKNLPGYVYFLFLQHLILFTMVPRDSFPNTRSMFLVYRQVLAVCTVVYRQVLAAM